MIAVGKRVFIAGKEVFFVGVGVEVINKCVIWSKSSHLKPRNQPLPNCTKTSQQHNLTPATSPLTTPDPPPPPADSPTSPVTSPAKALSFHWFMGSRFDLFVLASITYSGFI